MAIGLLSTGRRLACGRMESRGTLLSAMRPTARVSRIALMASAGVALTFSASSVDGAERIDPPNTTLEAVRSNAAIREGFRRYHAGCNHCHGPDGLGSTFAPSLVDHIIAYDEFRKAVLEGRRRGNATMQGFATDPNVVPHVDDIYAYLKARAAGVVGRGRPPETRR